MNNVMTHVLFSRGDVNCCDWGDIWSIVKKRE